VAEILLFCFSRVFHFDDSATLGLKYSLKQLQAEPKILVA
jgi:hypothetical protein